MHKLPLILLHGWGFSSRVWRPLIEALQSEGVYEVFAIDLPGFGSAYHEPAQTLDDALQYLGEQLPAQCLLCGWSLGGMFAVQFASRHPERVAGVVTLGSNLHFTQDGDWPGMPPDDFAQFCQRVEWQPEKTWRRFLSLQVQGDREPDALLLQLQALAQYEDVNPVQALRALQWLGEIDNRPLLSALSCRLLQIFAADDAITPAAVAARLSRTDEQTSAPKNAQTVRIMAGASHAMPLSHADVLARQLAEWMAA